MAARAAAEGIRAPAITLVGPVAALREQLAWLERRPLHGLSVAVTRARAQASALAARLRELGAAVVEAPAIRTRSLDASSCRTGGRTTSCASRRPNGVQRAVRAAAPPGSTPARSPGATVAAIGPGTARALKEGGIVADVVPDRAVAEGLVEALAGLRSAGRSSCAAREGRDVLPDALRARGASVDVVALYETVAEPPSIAAVAAASTT